MEIKVRAYEENDLPEVIAIWNEIVEEGHAFPQEEPGAGKAAWIWRTTVQCRRSHQYPCQTSV